MRKTISIILSAVLILSCIPFSSVAAAEDDVTEIRTIEDLYNVRYAPEKNYILMTDIDFSKETDSGFLVDDKDWKTIDSFSGVFDGNHHSFIGLTMPFICESDGTIKNLDIRDAAFYTSFHYESANTFGAFTISNSGSLEYCRIINSPAPDLNVNGYSNRIITSGIAAYNSGKIRYCANYNSDVSSSNMERKNLNMGGLCAVNRGQIEYCYCSCSINNTWTVDWTSYSGGVCGYNTGAIVNCYFSGDFGYVPSSGVKCLVDGIGCCKEEGTKKNCYTTINKQIWGENCYFQSNGGEENALSEVQMRQERYYIGFDFDNVWIIDPATAYKYPQLRDNRQDTDKEIDSVEFETAPSVVAFRTEDAMEASGSIRVYYIDGTHEDIEITEDMLSGYDMDTAGEQTVTVTYRGFTLTYAVTVTQRPDVIGITILSLPDRTEFVKDTRLDYTGGKVRIFYRDGTTDTVDLTPENAPGADITETGDYTAVFSYHGQSVEFSVTVVPVKVTQIRITSLPDKVTYVEGQSIDRQGLSVEGIYNNGETKLLTDYELNYRNTAGKQTVTVSYSGLTATFKVRFTKRVLESISVLSNPDKTEYYTDEAFDRTGMVVYASYNNGLSEEITQYTVSDIPAETGMHALEISYGGKSTYITVTVSVRMLTAVKITERPEKTKYNPGEAFDAAGMKVAAVYDNGTTKQIEDYTLSAILTDADGSYVTVAYGGLTCRLSVHVHSFTDEVIPPTCTEQGYTLHTCSVCADYYIDDQTDALGHNFGAWTELDENEHVRVCANDGSHIETAAHTWNKGKVTKKATCETDGVKTFTCIVCKATKTEPIPATGHAFGAWTELDEDKHERVCANDANHVETAAHTWNKGMVTAKATCETDGVRTYTCTVCKATKTELIPATGHAFGDWTELDEDKHERVCMNDASHVETAAHVWDAGRLVKAPAPGAEGEKQYVCIDCGAVKSESIEALPVETKAPTEPESTAYITYAPTEPMSTAHITYAPTEPESTAYITYAPTEPMSTAHITYAPTEPESTADTTYAPTTRPTVTEPTTAGPTQRITLGDVNGDGRINSMDARLALRAAARVETLTGIQNQLADVNGDGKIKAADARLILRIAARLDPTPEKQIPAAA